MHTPTHMNTCMYTCLYSLYHTHTPQTEFLDFLKHATYHMYIKIQWIDLKFCCLCLYSLYLKEGFLHLQNLVSMSIIEQIVGDLSPMYNFTEIPINVKVGLILVILLY